MYLGVLWQGPIRGEWTQVLLWPRLCLWMFGRWPSAGDYVCYRYWIVWPIEVRRFKEVHVS